MIESEIAKKLDEWRPSRNFHPREPWNRQERQRREEEQRQKEAEDVAKTWLSMLRFFPLLLSQLNGWFHGKIWVEININLFSRRKPAMIRFCFDPRCSVFPKTCGGTTSQRRRARTPTIGRRKDSGLRVFAVDISKCIERICSIYIARRTRGNNLNWIRIIWK